MQTTAFADKQTAWRRLMKDVFLKGKKHAGILDVPCGRGELYRIAKKCSKKFYGVDPSKKNLVSARVRSIKGHFRQGTVLDIPYPSGFVPVVVSWSGLSTITPEQLQQALGELFRVSGNYVCFNYQAILRPTDDFKDADMPPWLETPEGPCYRGLVISDMVDKVWPGANLKGAWQYGSLKDVDGFPVAGWLALYRKS